VSRYGLQHTVTAPAVVTLPWTVLMLGGHMPLGVAAVGLAAIVIPPS
jgi:hypothetical protein